MKIIFQREQLREAFDAVAKVPQSRSPRPVLQNVLLTAGMDGVHLLAQNDGCALRLRIDGCATVETAGDVLLSPSRFGSILKECKDEKLAVTVDGRGLQVKADRSTFKLPVENAQDYPQPSFDGRATHWKLPAKALAVAIGRTAFCCDDETSRYALGGVYFELSEAADLIRLVATDGRRMVVQECRAERDGEPSDGTVIVPLKSVRTIQSLCADDEGDAEFWIDGTSFFVRTSRGVVSARLLEGRFPEWQAVVPSLKGAVNLLLPIAALESCVRQAAVVCDRDLSRAIDWQAADGTLNLSARTAELGQATVELTIPHCEERQVSLDHRYILDYLASLGQTENVTVALLGTDRPCVMSPEDGNQYVLMPLANDK